MAVPAAARAAREGGAPELREALRESRRDTLATFSAYQRALPDLSVLQQAELNPPLWELGHIGWFQEYWIGRNPERDAGDRADPDVPRRAPLRADADLLYDSSHVPHDTRWSLPLPDATATCEDLGAQLAQSLHILAELDESKDDALYFHRLTLLHEDMHHEAALYMAQSLGIAIADPRWQPRPLPAPAGELPFAAARWQLGSDQPRGFAFDNEVGSFDADTPAYRIDAQVVRWADYLPFVEAGGYGQRQFWSDAGWAWRMAEQVRMAPQAPNGSQGPQGPHAAQGPQAPRYLRRAAGEGWQCWRDGHWLALDLRQAARHLTLHEAQAWCRWAGRRLPTEAEWERAALTRPETFAWGEVWEWTASEFQPFAGFRPHPYRDYSAPWFDGRPVLRGASFMTQPRMRHPRYRNFFQPHRSDVPAGFRSCAGSAAGA